MKACCCFHHAIHPPLHKFCCLLGVIESGLPRKLCRKIYSIRCVLQYISSNIILKIQLWLSTYLAFQHTVVKYKLYHRCFMLNFKKIFRANVVNTSGWVLLDRKSLAMCVLGFKNFGPQFWHFLLSFRYYVCQDMQFRNLCTNMHPLFSWKWHQNHMLIVQTQ